MVNRVVDCEICTLPDWVACVLTDWLALMGTMVEMTVPQTDGPADRRPFVSNFARAT